MRADDWHSFPSSFLLVAACPFSAWGRQAACRVPQGSMPCSPGVDRRCLWGLSGCPASDGGHVGRNKRPTVRYVEVQLVLHLII